MPDDEHDRIERKLSRLLAAQRAMPSQETDSLEELSIEQAQRIASLRSGTPIYLNSLKTLSPEVAQALGNEHTALALNGLKKLEVETAKALLPCEKRNLFLNGLESISVELVDALDGRHDFLGLNGLTTISDDVAKALQCHRGSGLSLKGLREISVEAATCLFYSDFASLSLIGLKQDGVTFEAWETLRGEWERDIEFPDDWDYWDYVERDE